MAIEVMPHYHTAFCERKREVCEAEGALREGNRLQVKLGSLLTTPWTPMAVSALATAVVDNAKGIGAAGGGAAAGAAAAPDVVVSWFRTREPLAAASSLIASPIASRAGAAAVGGAATGFTVHTNSDGAVGGAAVRPPTAWQRAAGYAGCAAFCEVNDATRAAQADADAPAIVTLAVKDAVGDIGTHSFERACRPVGPPERVFPLPLDMPSLAHLPPDPASPADEYAALVAGITGHVAEDVMPVAASAAADSPLFTIAAATRFARLETRLAHDDPCQYKLTLADVGHALAAVVYVRSADGKLTPVAQAPPVGPIQPAPPRIRDVAIATTPAAPAADGSAGAPVSVLTAHPLYFGGVPGHCAFAWIRVDPEGNRTDEVTRACDPWSPASMSGGGSGGRGDDPRCRVLTAADAGCDFKVSVTPVRVDGVAGAPTTSRLYSVPAAA